MSIFNSFDIRFNIRLNMLVCLFQKFSPARLDSSFEDLYNGI